MEPLTSGSSATFEFQKPLQKQLSIELAEPRKDFQDLLKETPDLGLNLLLMASEALENSS